MQHTFCYFDISKDHTALGQVVFEVHSLLLFSTAFLLIFRMVQLYDDACPKTCDNFKRLCEGVEKDGKVYQYKDTPFHRVVDGGWIQGGDIFGGKGNKGGSVSLFYHHSY